MFDQLVIVKIIEMQNEADRRRWRNDEDAFYRDLDHDFATRFMRFLGQASRMTPACPDALAGDRQG